MHNQGVILQQWEPLDIYFFKIPLKMLLQHFEHKKQTERDKCLI